MITQKSGGFSTFLPLIMMCAFVLIISGCSEYEQINQKVNADEKEISSAFDRIMPKQNPRQPLIVDQRPWFGSSAVPMLNGNPLPTAYQRRNGLVLTFTEGVTLQRATQMIQGVTGMRVKVSQNILAGANAGRNAQPVVFLPVDAEQVTGGRFVWQGRLSDLLDQIADTFNADWHFDGRVIRFSNEVTRTFMLHALATEMATADSLQGGDAGEGGALPDLSLDSAITLNIWDEIEEALDTIIGDTGQSSFSPSTGTITVTGSPEVVRRVESYLQQQNQMRLRRVAIAVKVLDVTMANTFDFQTSIDGVLAEILTNVTGSGAVSSAGGVITVTRSNTGTDAITSSLQLSELIERVSIQHSGAVVTLSDQPAPLQVGRQISYLERISSTAGDAGGQVSLEPGTVNEGLTMIALPRILDRDRILMRLSISITDAEEPFATFSSGDGPDALSIQLPEIATTGFLQNAYINSGETMVLAGFERNQNSYSDEGAPGGLWTGGNRGTNRSRNVTVLLLTAEILPADGLTVISQ